PYARLVEENAKRGKDRPEFELADTGVFEEGRYFDVTAEYAKASPDDILIRITVTNRGPQAAPLHVLPTLWFRNVWSWQCTQEWCGLHPRLNADGAATIAAEHETLGKFRLAIDAAPDGAAPELIFTENDTNFGAIFGAANGAAYVKDAFHERVV